MRRGSEEAREVGSGGEGGVPQGGADANHDAQQHLWFARWGGGKVRREKRVVRTAREEANGARGRRAYTLTESAREKGVIGEEWARGQTAGRSSHESESASETQQRDTQRKARGPRESTRASPRNVHAGTTGCS